MTEFPHLVSHKISLYILPSKYIKSSPILKVSAPTPKLRSCGEG